VRSTVRHHRIVEPQQIGDAEELTLFAPHAGHSLEVPALLVTFRACAIVRVRVRVRVPFFVLGLHADVGELLFVDLALVHGLLDRAGRDEPIHLRVLRLPQPERPVLRLQVVRHIPDIHMYTLVPTPT